MIKVTTEQGTSYMTEEEYTYKCERGEINHPVVIVRTK